VEFLRVVIGADRVRMEKEKVQEVVEWPVPKSIKDVQKFLGLTNYYRQFVKDFAKIVRLLHKMITEPVLVIPDLDREIRVEIDVSDFAMRGVLSMKCEDEKWRPVTYISKSLNEAKSNYEIHDKEILVIIQCLKAWRYFLEEVKDQFEIWTDHKNLEYFMKA